MTEQNIIINKPVKRVKRKKSSFYNARWRIVGLNEQRAADVLGVSVDQVKEWDFEGNLLAERFLLLWDSKRISEKGWEGFIFTQGKLKYKNRYWTPSTLLAEHEKRRSNDSIRYSLGLIDLNTDFKRLLK